MGLRHTAVVAGLALGLMSGTAHASFIYNVSYGQGGGGSGSPTEFGQVTGTITLDNNSGIISNTDIQAFDLSIYTNINGNITTDTVNNGNSVSIVDGSDFSVVNGSLIFQFNGDDGGVRFRRPEATFNLYAGQLGLDPSITVRNSGAQVFENFSVGQSVTIGTLSPVPLPASAPMFGAALLGLAGLGYAVKRKVKTAA